MGVNHFSNEHSHRRLQSEIRLYANQVRRALILSCSKGLHAASPTLARDLTQIGSAGQWERACGFS